MDVPNIEINDKQYMTTNQVVRGVIERLEADNTEDAAHLYSHCQEDVGFILMARAPKDRPIQARLAKMFYKAKDFEKAALVLEANKEYKRAAELYERTDQYEHAAEMWMGVNDEDRAARNYEKNGSWQTAGELYVKLKNFDRAAYCFEKSLDHIQAARYYYQIKKFQKSMEILQKVREEEEGFLEAAVMIGNILAMNGYLDMAAAKYRNVTKTVEISPGTLSVYYNLAQLLERKGDVFEATSVYEQVVSVDMNYRDAGARIKALKGKIAESGARPEDVQVELEEIVEDLQEIEEDEITLVPGGQSLMDSPKAQIVSVMDGFEFLKNTSLFDRLSLTEMKRMWNICETVDFQPAEMIIEQDQPGQALFIIKKGGVVVQRVNPGSVTDLVSLPAGSHVGEMALVDDESPTSARVVAGGDGAQAFKITREKFEELLASDDKIAIKVYRVFIRTLCDRLRKTTEDLSCARAILEK